MFAQNREKQERSGRKKNAFEYLQFSSVLVYPNLGSRTAERCDLVYCFHRGQQLRISARWIPLWEWTVFAWIRYDTFGWTRSMYQNPTKSPIVVQPSVVFFLSFFPFYLSVPIASFSASRIFLNSEFRTLSSREMARVDNNWSNWIVVNCQRPIETHQFRQIDFLEKREGNDDAAPPLPVASVTPMFIHKLCRSDFAILIEFGDVPGT